MAFESNKNKFPASSQIDSPDIFSPGAVMALMAGVAVLPVILMSVPMLGHIAWNELDNLIPYGFFDHPDEVFHQQESGFADGVADAVGGIAILTALTGLYLSVDSLRRYGRL